jgi:hypothetical protein
LHQQFHPTQFCIASIEPPSCRQLLPQEVGRALAVSKSPACEEFIMSARNGDKSRFNRERKQKIARRKRTYELLDRVARGGKSADTIARVRPRSVSA